MAGRMDARTLVGGPDPFPLFPTWWRGDGGHRFCPRRAFLPASAETVMVRKKAKKDDDNETTEQQVQDMYL